MPLGMCWPKPSLVREGAAKRVSDGCLDLEGKAKIAGKQPGFLFGAGLCGRGDDHREHLGHFLEARRRQTGQLGQAVGIDLGHPLGGTGVGEDIAVIDAAQILIGDEQEADAPLLDKVRPPRPFLPVVGQLPTSQVSAKLLGFEMATGSCMVTSSPLKLSQKSMPYLSGSSVGFTADI